MDDIPKDAMVIPAKLPMDNCLWKMMEVEIIILTRLNVLAME